MKVAEISFLSKLVLGYFRKYWATPKVVKIAREFRDGINELLGDEATEAKTASKK